MSVFEIIVLAVGLAMDAFAVSVCKGLSLGKINVRHMCIAGIWFGGFQAMMPVIGYFLAGVFADRIIKYDHWIAFVLLVIIGGSMIREAHGKEETLDASMCIGTMLVLAVATSIDALAVGVTFAFMKVNITASAIIIGVITFLFSAAGVKIGSLFGTRYKSRAEMLGGIILVLIGTRILIGGLIDMV